MLELLPDLFSLQMLVALRGRRVPRACAPALSRGAVSQWLGGGGAVIHEPLPAGYPEELQVYLQSMKQRLCDGTERTS